MLSRPVFTSHRDLPLEAPSLASFLPWIVAFMVYLAVLASLLVLAIGDTMSRWHAEIASTMTLQLPPPVEKAKQDRVLAELRVYPGIISAEVLSRDEITDLLAPWLGDELPTDLPVPALIDVVSHDHVMIDSAELERRILTLYPGAMLENHQFWFQDLVALARNIRLTAVIILLMLGLAGAGIIMSATRSSFAAFKPAIDVMHQIGAEDSYIINQFQAYGLLIGFKGGMVGLAAALLTTVILTEIGGHIDSLLLPEITLSWGRLASLGFMPLISAIIAMISARLAVRSDLTKLM